MLLVRIVLAQVMPNVLPAIQDTFCNHRRLQHALALVQMGIGKTLQLTVVLLAILLA